jgi:myo-inositol-1-phosphate synthase
MENKSMLRIAIAGVGNCASSLLQGIESCREAEAGSWMGLTRPDIGGYKVSDIRPVAAFDVDVRKVGKPLGEAVFAEPNCAQIIHHELPEYDVTVQMGPVLDGVADHMADYPAERAFRVADREPVDLVKVLETSRADVLVCYLPVGSEDGVRAYADACLEAGVAMVNAVPVFIASDPEYAARFSDRGLPIVGDDVKSQFGATILHRALAKLMQERGIRLEKTYQLNTGGNTDFLNMLERSRLASKKRSKTEAVQAELATRLPEDKIHIGPSDYVPWQEDNKVCFIRLEGTGFAGVPLTFEGRLSVQDSPNSAGVVVDALRGVKLALDRGISGPLIGLSAYTMKHPPQQITDAEASRVMDDFLAELEETQAEPAFPLAKLEKA